MKKIYLGLLLTVLSTAIHAQVVNLEWAKSMGGTGDDYGNSITTDASGNLYVTGYYQDTVDFDPGAATYNLTSNGDDDVFIQKLDAGGKFIWAKSMGGINSDRAYSITTDPSGNVLITGWYRGTVDFDPGAATFNLSSNGNKDIFIQKLDTGGNFIWAKSMGGTANDEGFSITTDPSGNVLITGGYSGVADFDPGAATFNLAPNGNYDVFIQKLDTGGIFIWAKSMGGTYYDYGASITTDTSGNVFITGRYEDTVDFDPGAGTFNLTPNGSAEVFIQKLDAGGNFIWAKSVGGTFTDIGWSITTDTPGNVYISGYFADTADFDPGAATFNLTSNGSWDIFIQKLDTGGNLLWAKSMGGTSNDLGVCITTDSSGNVYVTGYFADTADFDPGAATFNLTSNGILDGFIQKLDAGGNFIWAKSMGGTSIVLGRCITTDASGNVLIIGYYQDTADFDPGPGTFNLMSKGGYDIFIQKLNQCAPNTGTDVITSCDSSYTWIDGNTYIANNNTATDTLINVKGCDSVVTLNLTFSNSNTGVNVITACDSITWIDGNTYTASNNTATDTLTNANGCDSIVTLDLTINTVDTSVTTSDPTLTANATGASYQWLDCNNNHAIISGETAQTFTATKNGSYAVEVIENGCTDTSACVTISSFSIVKNILFDGVSIYPNPNSGLVTIDLGKLRDVSIKVFTAGGRLIYQVENINASNHQFEFNEAPGVYLVEVNAQGKTQRYKLVKE